MNGAFTTRTISNGNDECNGTIFLIITADSLVQRPPTRLGMPVYLNSR
jgi:hypothetical protein